MEGIYVTLYTILLFYNTSWFVCQKQIRSFQCDGGNICYTLTSSLRFKWCRAIQRSNCYHNEGHAAACEYGSTYYILIFGIIQVILSQVPDFRNTEWLSVIAATMSFVYSIIGSALGLAKVIGIYIYVPTWNYSSPLPFRSNISISTFRKRRNQR